MPDTKLLLLLSVALITVSACKKEAGPDGNATITGHVKHHEDAIPNATVYIKYGATELPGTDPMDYDDEATASASDAHYSFNGLKRGDYYLFAIGFDSACVCEVIGGVSISIEEKDETVETNVPVTE